MFMDDPAMIQPYPQMLEALQCIRAEGIKTAVLTNNWRSSSGESALPSVLNSYFDVVRQLIQ